MEPAKRALHCVAANRSRAVLAGDTLVVQTHDGELYGFRPR